MKKREDFTQEQRDTILPSFVLHESKTCRFLGPRRTEIGRWLRFTGILLQFRELPYCAKCAVSGRRENELNNSTSNLLWGLGLARGT